MSDALGFVLGLSSFTTYSFIYSTTSLTVSSSGLASSIAFVSSIAVVSSCLSGSLMSITFMLDIYNDIYFILNIFLIMVI